MANYNNGKIYRIVCNKTGLCYIGSTTYDTLAQRLCSHKSAYKKWLTDTTKNKCSSVLVMENDDYDIVLVETVNCDSRDELRRRERYWIENTECVNLCIPTRTHAEYRDTHREQMLDYNQKHYAENREKMIEIAKAYRDKNPDKMKENSRKATNKAPTLCDCGVYYSYTHKLRHLESKKHLKNIQNIPK